MTEEIKEEYISDYDNTYNVCNVNEAIYIDGISTLIYIYCKKHGLFLTEEKLKKVILKKRKRVGKRKEK